MLRALLRVSILAVGLLWGLTAAQRTDHVWIDERSVWTDAVQQSPKKPRPWVNLGNQYTHHREYDLAADAYRTASALATHPARSLEERTQGWAVAETNLAMLQAQGGDIAGAWARVSDISNRVHSAKVRQVERWLAKQLPTP